MSESSQSTVTVVVTGVGAIIGQGIIRSLRSSRHSVRIIGLDRSARSPAPGWCDRFVQKPSCDEESIQYLTFWEDLIVSEHVDIVLPGLEVDMLFLDKHREDLARAGAALALNHSALIQCAGDKWHMHQLLLAHNMPVIPSAINVNWAEAVAQLGDAPILMKPRQGNGSRGIVHLNDGDDLAYWSRKAQGPWMLQRIVGRDDEEYTVGVFGLGRGQALGPIIFRRRLSAAGNTLEAQVVDHPLIQTAVERLNALLEPVGPTNYQFRMENDLAFLLEVNPRFSSSNSLRTRFGYNEAEMSLDHFLFDLLPPTPSIRYGIGWRFSEDNVVYDRHPI